MVERQSGLTLLTHAVLLAGIAVVAFPIYVTFVASTHTLDDVVRAPMPLLPGHLLVENYRAVLTDGLRSAGGAPVGRMLVNSLVMALVIAAGKIAISLLSAFAIVYFRFPFRAAAFWTIFLTLMLPVEVRIVPTYKVIADLGMLNSYAGLTVPLIASATATFLFRQFFLTVPDELLEAARIDGAGPLRFFASILVPVSRTSIAALFVILFIYGWNQYLWPLLVTTDEAMYTIVVAIHRMVAVAEAQVEWQGVMATAMLAMVPPIVVVIVMQRWFVKGLVETDAHMTSDGEIVVIHDPTLDRTTMGRGAISELATTDVTAARLKDRAGRTTDERVPTLAQLLDLLAPQRAQLLLEIKVDARNRRYPGIEEKALALLRSRRMAERTLVMAFEPETVARVRELDPAIRTVLLVGRRQGARDAVQQATALRANVIGYDFRLLDADLVAATRTAGLKVAAWTVNEETDIRRIVGLGVDVVISDRPDLALRLVRP